MTAYWGRSSWGFLPNLISTQSRWNVSLLHTPHHLAPLSWLVLSFYSQTQALIPPGNLLPLYPSFVYPYYQVIRSIAAVTASFLVKITSHQMGVRLSSQTLRATVNLAQVKSIPHDAIGQIPTKHKSHCITSLLNTLQGLLPVATGFKYKTLSKSNETVYDLDHSETQSFSLQRIGFSLANSAEELSLTASKPANET